MQPTPGKLGAMTKVKNAVSQEMGLEWINSKHFELSNVKTKTALYAKFHQLNEVVLFLMETGVIDYDCAADQIERLIKTHKIKKVEVLDNEMR